MAQTYKRLGTITATATTSGTTADTLYQCSTTLAVVASTITICNTASVAATYRVCVSTTSSFPSGTGANAYDGYIAYGASVGANDTVFLTIGTTLDAVNRYLLVSANANTVVFNAFGVEMTL